MGKLAEHPFLGYKLYVVLHRKLNRRMACLVNLNNRNRTTISYARYILSVHLGRKLTEDETVDHIDGDKLNDVVGNLQILSREENTRKSAKGRTVKQFICPICKKEFALELRQIHNDQPCCSRKCGSIKGWWGR